MTTYVAIFRKPNEALRVRAFPRRQLAEEWLDVTIDGYVQEEARKWWWRECVPRERFDRYLESYAEDWKRQEDVETHIHEVLVPREEEVIHEELRRCPHCNAVDEYPLGWAGGCTLCDRPMLGGTWLVRWTRGEARRDRGGSDVKHEAV